MGGNRSDDPTAAVRPARAPVVPRVRPLDGGEVLPIEERVVALLRHHRCGLVSLSGPQRSGKSTALAHLAAVLPPDAPVALFDEVTSVLGRAEAERAAQAKLMVIASQEPSGLPCVARLAMAPWGDDDLIEYLLATHRAQCQAVMFKVKSYARHLSLGGSPELWRMVLDTMAADPAIPDVAAALRRCLGPMLSDPKFRAAHACLASLRAEGGGKPTDAVQTLDPAVRRLAQHRPVQVLLASELIVHNLCDGVGWSALAGKLPHDLVLETARLAAHWPAAVERLDALVASPRTRVHPMAASLLLAIRPDWRPGAVAVPTLSGAYVAGAHWAGVDLHGGSLSGADLRRADLSRANLAGARASAATFRDASLRGAKLDKLCATGSDLARAQLASASADGASLRDADLRGADLHAASLRGADLTHADLSEAVLTSATLREAVLEQTKLNGADLVGADFTCAVLRGVRLAEANLAGTSFYCADLSGCELEGLTLPRANFAGAKLNGCYLTGSVMPGADFQNADLRGAGLAEVDWEGADLREADLRGATFHMGSTRSGLVGSAVPCEGSKTGFYTDDFNDRDFKTPEEIRKANLCRADLRGARVKGVDFYLVDLRGAHFTDKQARYFRRCGAILE